MIQIIFYTLGVILCLSVLSEIISLIKDDKMTHTHIVKHIGILGVFLSVCVFMFPVFFKYENIMNESVFAMISFMIFGFKMLSHLRDERKGTDDQQICVKTFLKNILLKLKELLTTKKYQQ